MSGYIVGPRDADAAGWRIDPDDLIASLRQNWPEAEPYTDPHSSRPLLAWDIQVIQPVHCWFDPACPTGLYLEGDLKDCVQVALWFRTLVPPDQPLYFDHEDVFDDHPAELHPGTAAQEVLDALGMPSMPYALPPEMTRLMRGVFYPFNSPLFRAMIPHEVVDTPDAPPAEYAQGAKASGKLFVSPQRGIIAQTGQLAGATVTGQTIQALKNIRAILAAGGVALAQIASVIVILANPEDRVAMDQAYKAFFQNDPVPIYIVSEGHDLPPGVLVEITVYADLVD
jgi:2-iminobutanoate/2-iminopropanoate deaminase